MAFFFLALALALLSLVPSLADDGKFRTYSTQYATVYYVSEEELIDFGKKIGPSAAYLNRDPEKSIAQVKPTVDRIVFRVRTLLDMYPPNFQFNIYILKGYEEMKAAYRDTGHAGKAPIAFYLLKNRSIYVSLERINDGILAHEVAHAVINAYFEVPPPGQMQEILAQYVDKHLRDE